MTRKRGLFCQFPARCQSSLPSPVGEHVRAEAGMAVSRMGICRDRGGGGPSEGRSQHLGSLGMAESWSRAVICVQGLMLTCTLSLCTPSILSMPDPPIHKGTGAPLQGIVGQGAQGRVPLASGLSLHSLRDKAHASAAQGSWRRRKLSARGAASILPRNPSRD